MSEKPIEPFEDAAKAVLRVDSLLAAMTPAERSQFWERMTHEHPNSTSAQLLFHVIDLLETLPEVLRQHVEPVVEHANQALQKLAGMKRKMTDQTRKLVTLIDEKRSEGLTVDEAITTIRKQKPWKDCEPHSLRTMYYVNRKKVRGKQMATVSMRWQLLTG